MRGIRGRSLLAVMLCVGMISGCQTAATRRPPTVVTPAPSVEGGVIEGGAADKTIPPTPTPTVSFVDRHPLFSKPREYWQTSGDKKVVKAAAATFIGVPAGVVGEFKQIIVGTPQAPRY